MKIIEIFNYEIAVRNYYSNKKKHQSVIRHILKSRVRGKGHLLAIDIWTSENNTAIKKQIITSYINYKIRIFGSYGGRKNETDKIKGNISEIQWGAGRTRLEKTTKFLYVLPQDKQMSECKSRRRGSMKAWQLKRNFLFYG